MPKMKQLMKQMTEDRIIESAKLLFLEIGYEKTTTAAIAKKTGIAEGTLYNYFPSKAAMLFKVFEAYLFDENLTFVNNPFEHTDSDFVKSILNLINHYWGSLSILDKKIYKIQNIELLKAQYSMDPAIGPTIERYTVLEHDIKTVVKEHVNATDRRTDILTQIILALAHWNMDRYALDDDIDAEMIWLEISNQLDELL